MLAIKKQKKNLSASLENCTTSDAGILNAHFSLLFFFNRKMQKKKDFFKIYNTLLHVRHQV